MDDDVDEMKEHAKVEDILCVRKVGKQWGTVTLPDELKPCNSVVFRKELSTGRIYVSDNTTCVGE